MVFILSSKTRWNQECHKRWLQWRYVNRLTLHFTRKSEILTNGLPKMCFRLEPQQHFEAACCNGIPTLAVAGVSCMSVCKMRPRPNSKAGQVRLPCPFSLFVSAEMPCVPCSPSLLWLLCIYLQGGVPFCTALCKYPGSEFYLSSALPSSRPLDKYLESFSRSLI